MRTSKPNLLTFTILAMTLACPHQNAQAAEGADAATDTAADSEPGATVVVTGSRGKPRTVADSPVPIDVLPAQDIQQSGFTDTKNVLQNLLPSYEVQRNSNSDAGSFVRPATLRGLPGDDTLVLLNSKRRHRSAAVSAGGDGSQAADVAQIPAEAVKSVEVLRDGAAALYGSDAIAGVINFILKDADHGGGLTARYGQYYAGDGEDVLVTGNIGLPLTSRGFINATVEYTHQERTSRGVQFCNATFCAETYAQTHPDYANWMNNLGHLITRLGQPLQEAVRGVVNSGIDFDTSKLYAFATYSYSNTHTDATYRYPAAGQVPADVAVRLQDGSIFKYDQTIYPYGFTPDYSAKLVDYSAAAGYKGSLLQDAALTYDFSARYGRSKMQYFISNTVNATLGPDSPHSFMRAIYIADDLSADADFGYSFKPGFLSNPVNLEFGTEFHREGFQMKPGEPAAYAQGPWTLPDPFGFCSNEADYAQRTLNPGAPQNAGIDCTSANDPVYHTLPALTLTVSPATAGSLHRDNWAGYVEASNDITSSLTLDVAGRYESYTDFGSTMNWKASGRYKLLDNLAVRGSVGTGFRAPTPGQQIFNNLSVGIVDGVITNSGLLAVTNPAAKYLGAQPLRPEKAFNLTGGLTATLFNQLNLTVDFYQIRITDQYYSTSQIPVTPAIRAQMEAAGVPGADALNSVSFFQNAFDSKTYGVDVVAAEKIRWDDGQSTGLTLAFNWNKYEIQKVKIGGLFDGEAIYDFSHAIPLWKALVTGTHEIGRFSAMARVTVWGPYSNMFSVANPKIQEFGIKTYLDLELGYRVMDGLKATLGARNVLDTFPDKDLIGETTGTGNVYRSDSVEDWQGGFYYLRLDYQF